MSNTDRRLALDALSMLENYGHHHGWCAQQPGDCDCGFNRERVRLEAALGVGAFANENPGREQQVKHYE